MKKNYLTLAVAMMMSLNMANAQELSSDQQKLGYALGLDMVSNLQEMGMVDEIDQEAFMRGLRDGLNPEAKRALTEEEIEKTFEKFMEKRSAEMEAELKAEEEARQKLSEENEKLGKAFLEENKGKEGVKVTNSGLQYKVLQEGKGEKPTIDNEVEVRYKGTLISGEVFDASENSTVKFPLKYVIAGWQEGLQLMTEGSKYQFFIPAELAYGKEGAGDDVPPNATLIFEVELVKVIKSGK
ncbi:MAG: FKBP-type peptidyl-prolyl cis-trans isomerase [Cardiobacteriaceae bacterium]|nr:FKBP-type peptidyl-prolyl cis-trans isomerase [Cardiobacteriaceae bacterium]